MNSASLVISKDFFDKVAKESKDLLDVSVMKRYVQKGIEIVTIAQAYAEQVDKNFAGSYSYDNLIAPAEILAIGGVSMIMMALHPYHLFSHFAWHSTNTHKHKKPEQIVAAYYEFFTETQWNQLNRYVNMTIKDNTIGDLLERISRIGMSGGKNIGQVLTSSEIRSVETKFDQVRNDVALIKIIGNNATKLFVDTYSA
jgi:hypothetical protein